MARAKSSKHAQSQNSPKTQRKNKKNNSQLQYKVIKGAAIDENGQQTSPVITPKSFRIQRKISNFQYPTQIFLLVIFIGMIIMAVFISQNYTNISRIREQKAMILCRPAAEFFDTDKKPKLISWNVVEYSKHHIFQFNKTHVCVEMDGFYQISCTLQMYSNGNQTNAITLLMSNSDQDKSTYVKESLLNNTRYFSLQQQPIIQFLKQGNCIDVQVIPLKYLSKDPRGSYLMIVQQ